MYCRNCGSKVNEKAEVCVKCGCRPLNGTDYCQECGSITNEKQEICVKCGVRLKKSLGNTSGGATEILKGINVSGNTSDTYNLDFSDLDPYYQVEFQKIYDSGETYKGKFNIWGLLFGGIWALTKGCWLSAIIAFVLSFLTYGIAGVVYWFIYGFRGTYMYYCAYVKGKQCIV